MHRLALLITAAAVAVPAAAPAPASASCDYNPAACTTVRFVTTCSGVIVREVGETVATGRPQSIACPL